MQIEFENIKWDASDPQQIEITIPFNNKTQLVNKFAKSKYKGTYSLCECVPRILAQSQLLLFVQMSLVYRKNYDSDAKDGSEQKKEMGFINIENSYLRCIDAKMLVIDLETNCFQESQVLSGHDMGTAIMLDSSTIAITGLQKPCTENINADHNGNTYYPQFRIQNSILIINYIHLKSQKKQIDPSFVKSSTLDEEIQLQLKLATLSRNPQILCSRPRINQFIISVVGGQLPYSSVVCGKGEVFKIEFEEQLFSQLNDPTQIQGEFDKFTQYQDLDGFKRRYIWIERKFQFQQICLDLNVSILNASEFDSFMSSEVKIGSGEFDIGQFVKKFPVYQQALVKKEIENYQIKQDKEDAEVSQTIVSSCQDFPINSCQLVSSRLIDIDLQQDNVLLPVVKVDLGEGQVLIGCDHQIQGEKSEIELQYLGTLIGGANNDKKFQNWKKESYALDKTRTKKKLETSHLLQGPDNKWSINNELSELSVYGVYLRYLKDYQTTNIVIFKLPMEQIINTNALVLWQFLTGTRLLNHNQVSKQNIQNIKDPTRYANFNNRLYNDIQKINTGDIIVDNLNKDYDNKINSSVIKFNQIYQTNKLQTQSWDMSSSNNQFQILQQTGIVSSRFQNQIISYIINIQSKKINQIQIQLPGLLGCPLNISDSLVIAQIKLEQILVSQINNSQIINDIEQYFLKSNQVPYGKLKSNTCLTVKYAKKQGYQFSIVNDFGEIFQKIKFKQEGSINGKRQAAAEMIESEAARKLVFDSKDE